MLRFGKFLVVVVLFTVLVLVSRNASAAWPDSSFERCMNVTVSNAGSSSLTNFPAYINLTHDEDMQPDFTDIRFYNESCNNGGVLLDYEIESYTTSDRAHIWVRIPSLSTSGETISVYYKNKTIVGEGNNTEGVWDDNYVLVMHLDEASGNMSDSSGAGNNADLTDITTYQATGKVGYGVDMVAVNNDEVRVPHSTDWAFTAGFTLEAWVETDVNDTYAEIIRHWDGVSVDGFRLRQTAAGSGDYGFQVFVDPNDTDVKSDNPPSGNFDYVVGVRNESDNTTMFVDGSKQAGVGYIAGAIDSYDQVHIGTTGSTGYYDGVLDEIRISNVTRSPDWINQTYQMVANQVSFVSFGGEETIPSIPIDNCSVLDSAGETYLLTQDIWDSTNSTCISIQADNVTLDCQGNWIDGTDGGSSYGVRIANYDNATVRNCGVSDWAYGIDLTSSTKNEIYNNFITSITDRGINIVSSSTYNNFTNNTVFSNQDYGVFFSSSTDNNFSHGNVSVNTNHGFYFTNSDNNRIEYSTIWLNTQDGVNLASSDGNVMYENNVTSNQARGIYMTSSSGNRIEGGNVKSNSNTGVWIYQSTSNNVSGVNVSLNGNNGIYFESNANGNWAEDCVLFDNNANGIYSQSSSNNIIINIESYSNSNGILINFGGSNNVSRSRIYSSDTRGVRITDTSNNYIIDTNVSASSSEEVYADDSGATNNYFINSTFDKNDVFVGTNTIIWVRWYLQIEARDVSETPLEDANVSIKDTYGYSWFTGQTNSSGYIPRQILNEYNQTSGGKNFYTNYAINVTKSNYVSNQTSENLTVSKVRIIYLQPIGPPVVKVKTYTKALVEKSVFKPNRMVRTRATVTSSEGRNYVSNATIVIKDHLGVTKVDNENMTNISEVANGYVYEYNYTLPGDAQGLWLINVTSIDIESREGYDFKKIAVTILNIQVKLLLNDTWDSAKVYIPKEGEKTFAQLGLMSPYSDSNPPHYYLASYLNNVLTSLVLSPDNPLSISASTGSGNYELETNQKFSNSMVFLVFSRGNWRQVNNRMRMIERGEFLSQISPTFSYGLGNKYPLKIMLSYDNIDINDTLSIGRGYGRISIENKGAIGSKVNLGIERV